jgi:hypothetical protein
LKRYNIDSAPENYALFIIHGEHELRCKSEDLPLMIFKELDRKGLKPMFMLRKITSVPDPSWERARNESMEKTLKDEESGSRIPLVDASTHSNADFTTGERQDARDGIESESKDKNTDTEVVGQKLKEIYGIDDLSKFLVSHGSSKKTFVQV